MATNNIEIREIYPSDIISDSMHKINYNFLKIAEHEDITEYKLAQLSKEFNEELDNIKGVIDARELSIFKSINQLSNRITELPSLDKLQSAIDVAISNSTGDLEDFIRQTAGSQISSMLGGYAKQSWVRDQDAIISSAFTKYTADARSKYASLSQTVGNSKFLRDKDTNCFLWIESESHTDGEVSTYHSIEDYYNGNDISTFEKQYIDGDCDLSDKLKDPDVMIRLIDTCTQHFKTVATELATITEEVGDGFSRTTLLNWVRNPNDDGDIVAAIFLEANKDTGSKITLNADHILMDANHKLELKTGEFIIDSNNLKVNVDGDGKVVVNGEINATKLKVGVGNKTYDLSDSESAKLFVRAFETPNPSGGEGGEGGETEPYDDGWLRKAYPEVDMEGGILLAGNLLVGDSEGNITAGMMGAGTDDNDLRFFAGSNFENRTKAAFQVYEDGSVIANNITLVANGGTTIGPLVYEKDGNIYFGDGKTWIGSDGTLHSTNADIDYNVKAKEFEAIDTISENLTKRTVITGDSFNIGAEGSVVSDGNEYNVTGNCLSIEIMDKVKNENEEIPGEYLYGIPVLTFRYKDPTTGTPKKYYLSTAHWINSEGSSSSNMRWVRDKYVLRYSLNTNALSTNTTYLVKDGSNYLFNSNKISTYINESTNKDELFKLMVYDWGEDSTSTQSLFQQAGLSEGLLGYESVIKDEYQDFSNTTTTKITSSSCQIFKNYVISSSSPGLTCSYSTSVNSLESGSVEEYVYNWLLEDIMSSFTTGMGSNPYWNVSGDLSGRKVTVIGLDKNMPFETGGSYTYIGDRCDIDIDYYPIINISNGSYTSSTVDTLYVKCRFEFRRGGYSYSGGSSNNRLQYKLSDNDSYVYFDPTNIDINLSFCLILKNTGLTFNPSTQNASDVILPYIKNYLNNYNFKQKVNNTNYVNFYVTLGTNSEIGDLNRNGF